MKPEDEKTEIEKLEEEIESLKTKIKNTEYDLVHTFKGNSLIEQKLKNSRQSLGQKQKALSLLKPEQIQNSEIQKLKEEITEKKTAPISAEQEKEIEDEIDYEFV